MDQRDEMFDRVCQISGALDGVRAEQARHGAILDRIEGRMDGVESTVKVHSVVGGGLVAGVVTLAMDYIKMKLAGS
ncbi:MAG: hypothetical protein H7837_11340 [Magnetococcus sp. MYC-9]